MNFDDAIKAHSNWKIRLKRYISNPDGSIDVSKTSRDDVCELGQWLKGDGKKLAANPTYQQLVSEHAKFHKCAADIVARCDKGENVQEEMSLGSSSDFSKHSMNVVSCITSLKRM